MLERVSLSLDRSDAEFVAQCHGHAGATALTAWCEDVDLANGPECVGEHRKSRGRDAVIVGQQNVVRLRLRIRQVGPGGQQRNSRENDLEVFL